MRYNLCSEIYFDSLLEVDQRRKLKSSETGSRSSEVVRADQLEEPGGSGRVPGGGEETAGGPREGVLVIVVSVRSSSVRSAPLRLYSVTAWV